jgi:hypothetical protein
MKTHTMQEIEEFVASVTNEASYKICEGNYGKGRCSCKDKSLKACYPITLQAEDAIQTFVRRFAEFDGVPSVPETDDGFTPDLARRIIKLQYNFITALRMTNILLSGRSKGEIQ